MRDFWTRHIGIGRVNFCLGHNPSIDLETRGRFSWRHDKLDNFRAISIRIGRLFLDVDVV